MKKVTITLPKLAMLATAALAWPVVWDYGIRPTYLGVKATVAVYDAPARLDKVEAEIAQVQADGHSLQTNADANFQSIHWELNSQAGQLRRIESILTKTNGAADDPAGYFSLRAGQSPSRTEPPRLTSSSAVW